MTRNILAAHKRGEERLKSVDNSKLIFPDYFCEFEATRRRSPLSGLIVDNYGLPHPPGLSPPKRGKG